MLTVLCDVSVHLRLFQPTGMMKFARFNATILIDTQNPLALSGKMGSFEDTCLIPSISYADLLCDNAEIRCHEASKFIGSLKVSGVCRIRDHGIPQSIVDSCFEKVG